MPAQVAPPTPNWYDCPYCGAEGTVRMQHWYKQAYCRNCGKRVRRSKINESRKKHKKRSE